MRAPTVRYGYVDSIRGLAALTVVYFHVADDFLKSSTPSAIEYAIFYLVSGPIDLGKVAVTLFFAVSGFVVPFSLLRGRENPIRDFVISRFFRLYPAYWLSIPFGILAFYVVRPNPIDAVTILANITMLQQFVGIENIIQIYWTLQIELIFYGLCVALFLCGWLRSNNRVFLVALAMIAFAAALAGGRFVTGKELPVALGLALTVMFFGLLWRRYILDGDLEARRRALIVAATLVVALPPIAWMGYGPEAWSRYTLTYYLAVGLFILMTTRLRIEHRIFIYLGTISYSIYLFGSASRVFAMAVIPKSWGGALHGHLIACVTMLITVAVAIAVYHRVEKPAINLGRAVTRRLDTRRVPEPSGI